VEAAAVNPELSPPALPYALGEDAWDLSSKLVSTAAPDFANSCPGRASACSRAFRMARAILHAASFSFCCLARSNSWSAAVRAAWAALRALSSAKADGPAGRARVRAASCCAGDSTKAPLPSCGSGPALMLPGSPGEPNATPARGASAVCSKSSHCEPVQPAVHRHLPRLHAPWPQQLFGQSRSKQDGPKKPAEQTHRPATQRPFAQLPSHSCHEGAATWPSPVSPATSSR